MELYDKHFRSTEFNPGSHFQHKFSAPSENNRRLDLKMKTMRQGADTFTNQLLRYCFMTFFQIKLITGVFLHSRFVIMQPLKVILVSNFVT